jgi:hypothetical protein
MNAVTTAILVALIAAVFLWLRVRKRGRSAFISNYAFPHRITQKVQMRYPHLTDEKVKLVDRALRDYFHVCKLAGRRQVAMPSQVVDAAWHEFILYTLEYEHFCSRAFGRFLHHTPAEAMQGRQTAQEGIKRAWRFACLNERIDRKVPSRLPLLFAIDSELSIPDGFNYALNCNPVNRDEYCASDIGCSSGGGCSGGDAGGSGCGSGCGGGD